MSDNEGQLVLADDPAEEQELETQLTALYDASTDDEALKIEAAMLSEGDSGVHEDEGDPAQDDEETQS